MSFFLFVIFEVKSCTCYGLEFQKLILSSYFFSPLEELNFRMDKMLRLSRDEFLLRGFNA